MITRLDAQIKTMMPPYRAEEDLLATTLDIGKLAAAAVISEIGADVMAYIPDAVRLVSRARDLPGPPRIGRQAALGQAPPRQPGPRARPGRGCLAAEP